MSKFSKALELIGVSPKESRDSFDDDYFEDDFEQEEPKQRASSSSQERSDRYSKSRYGQRRDVLDDDNDEQSSFAPRASASPAPAASVQTRGRLSTIRGGAAAGNARTMVIHAPASYQESQSLVSQLKQNKQIMIKLDAVERSDAQRILDFMSGAAYALECQVIKISKGIYLFASNDVQIERPEEDETEQTPADDFYNVDDTRRR